MCVNIIVKTQCCTHTHTKASEECYFNYIIYKMCKCLQTILYIVHWNTDVLKYKLDFPGGAVVKNPPANAGDEGNGKPLQYACLGNAIDWGPWQTTIHGVTKSWMWLGDKTCKLYVKIIY